LLINIRLFCTAPMAIFHLTQSHISRSTGRTAVGAWAYVTAGKVTCERTGVTFDYGAKDDVVMSGMVLTAHAPEWAQDGERFWNELAAFEDRLGEQRYKNPDRRERILGQVREGLTQELSLPRELTIEQNQELVLDYIAQNITARGLECGYGMHWDSGNPHVHIIVCERKFTDQGTFSPRKEKDLQQIPFLQTSRELWAVLQNQHLLSHGFDVQVDHRSHKDRGLAILPTIHEGWYAQAKARLGEKMDRLEINKSIKAQNATLVTEAPLEILKEISSLKATFTEQDITKLIFSRVQGDETLFHAVHGQVMNHAELIKVGSDLSGREIFSTAAYKASEEALTHTAQTLVGKQDHKLNAVRVNKTLKAQYGYFNAAQKAAVRQVCNGEALSVVIGRAGTGKTSTVLMASSSLYQEAGYRVRGMALAGAAVDNLAQDLNIEARTIASWEWAWNQYEDLKAQLPHLKQGTYEYNRTLKQLETLKGRQLTSRDVIILDEIGMVGVSTLGRVLAKASEVGAKVIGAGDNHQFAAIEAGDGLRALLQQVNASELKEIKRQHESWMQEASQKFAELQTTEGLAQYHKQGCIHWQESEEEALVQLTEDYIQDKLLSPGKSQLVLAYTHVQVDAINSLIRAGLIEQGILKEFTKVGSTTYAVGERIVFLKNDNQGHVIQTLSPPTEGIKTAQGVKNGTLGTIYAFDKHNLYVKLDDGRSIRFSPQDYKSFKYGYAVTAHKSQGATVDNVYVMASSFIDANAAYVMMTRHRDKVGLYTSHETFEDFTALSRQLSRVQNKDLILDYTITEEHRPFWQRVQDYQEMTKVLAEMRSGFEGQSGSNHKSNHKSLSDLKNLENKTTHGSEEELGNSLRGLNNLPSKKAFTQHWESYQALKIERDGLAKTIARNWESHGLYVQQCHIPRETLEVHAGMKPKRLTEAEKRARDRVELYADATTKARDLWNKIKLTHSGGASRYHERYGEFEALRLERDSLASTLADNARLHRPFTKDNGVNWQAIKSQTEAHLQRGLEKSFYERLSEEEKTLYDQVQAYLQIRNQCTQVWHELKGKTHLSGKIDEKGKQLENNKTPDRALKPWENDGFEAWKLLRDERDKQAAKITEQIKDARPFFERLKVSEDSIYQYAHCHQMRTLVNEFKENKDTLYGDLLADRIQQWQLLEREEGKSYTASCIMEAEIKPWEIKDAVNRNALAIHKLTLSSQTAASVRETTINNTLSKPLSPSAPWYDANEVTEALKPHTRELATLLLGAPNQHMSNAHELRFGKSGKIVVNLSGDNIGTWYDFKSDESGNLLKLIQREQQVGFKDAILYAAEFAGLSPEQRPNQSKTVQFTQSETVEALTLKKQEDQARKLEQVQRLYEESVPIQGTLAERYLKEHRSIQAELPESLRFHASAYESQTKQKLPALIAFAKDSEGTLKAAQVTYLDGMTAGKVNQEEIAVNKRSRGIVKGAFVELQKGEGPVYIAEGVETALSIKEAGVKGTVIASLGIFNIESIDLSSKANHEFKSDSDILNRDNNLNTSLNPSPRALTSTIIICADNDGIGSNTHKLIDKATQALEAKGHSVQVIRPAQEGYDFNDILKQEGVVKVAAYVQETIQTPQVTPSIDAVDSRHQQPSFTENDLLPKAVAEPQEEAKKAQTQEVESLTPRDKDLDSFPKLTENDKLLPVKSDTDETTRIHSSEPEVDTTPSIESYQTLLEQEGIIGNQIRLTKDPTLYKERESVQLKIQSMAHSMFQDPELMAKAKEIDLHFNIERMAAWHNSPRPSSELSSPSRQVQEPSKESPLITEYLKLKKTYEEVGFTTQAGRDALGGMNVVCHKIAQDTHLYEQVKSQSKEMYENIQLRAGYYETDLKRTLKKGIKYKL
jgi:ATP-dependent exoDNAse (exonuclease V) alpha subunit